MGTALAVAIQRREFAMNQPMPNAFGDEAISESRDIAVTLHACATCLGGEDRKTMRHAGRRLHDALAQDINRALLICRVAFGGLLLTVAAVGVLIATLHG
jgi:hypothetical protein